MKAIDLIGQVAAGFLKRSINIDEASEGVARYMLDRLTAQQVAAVCHAIRQDTQLVCLVKIQVPRSLVGDYGLPEAFLTDERTVHLRHSPCELSALLLANTSDDDQAQSLGDITSLGAQELKSQIDLWIDCAARDLPISENHLNYWRKAIEGLQKVISRSLEQFAEYVVETRSYIQAEGLPILDALGRALPALHLPCDSGYFGAIPETQLGKLQRWEKAFQELKSKRECLLEKQRPNRKPIEEQELRDAFEKVKEDIPEIAHPAISAFINSSAGWNTESEALAKFEWETNSISSLFSGLQTQKTDLASLTIDFFSDEFPDVLTDLEVQYLNALKKRNKKEALDDDREFYEAHRPRLEDNRKLKAKWDKFVYGQPIECNDFLIGLLQAFERLFDQADSDESIKSLSISTQKSSRKSGWLELNANIGQYFCTRYRGIEKLTSPYIEWDTHWLFKYDGLLESEKKKQKSKYKENTSIARSAIEIKFYVEMRDKDRNLIAKTQLIWKGNPNAIGMELYSDLLRLHENSPFQISQVQRELVSKKGKLQGISLSDVGTLSPGYNRDRGSLIGKYERKSELDKLTDKLKKSAKEGKLPQEAVQEILEAWEQFKAIYKQAIATLVEPTGEGIASPTLIHQCEAYGKLLTLLLIHAKGDSNRLELYQTILHLGCVRVGGMRKDRGKPAAIVAPWQPLRLAAIAVKTRQLAGLLRHILSESEVNFGDSRLFFADLRNDLLHPHAPEVSVGYQGREPKILAVSDTVNDYSLMEPPIKDETDRSTHEDPTDAAEKLLRLINRYVELLPHEKANLSVVLYQTDSVKLPLAIVNKLGDALQEEGEEVRCQVILRHRDPTKLAQLYEQMIESSDVDPDAFIASEVSQDFMARLRISVMPKNIPPANPQDGKFADIVFLQDAISRQARVIWQPTPFDETSPNMLTYFPARWSRKRPAPSDEMRSTVYLTCPKQFDVGQAYLDAVYSIIEGKDLQDNQHFLPARQISFQDEQTRTIFDETHRLGEWVVNYDDLLERRQLVNQGVKVIRYQQHRTDERNFLVSSSASLNLLEVLVRKRLEALNLGIESNRIDKLVQSFIDEANTLSGDIVLRAAKCGIFASELMGVVLSKAIVTEEIGKKYPIGWYFLDDYASWLGQKEGQIADIMAISPQYIDGQPVLKIVIAEAKYVDISGVADARKTSQNQLRDTVYRIADALFISPGRLDRDLWLSRLSDLMLEGIEFSANTMLPIEQWREGLRTGTIRIDLSGYSHVFVSGMNDSNIESERIFIQKVDRCFQETYDRESVRKLVLAHESKQSLFTVRELIGDDKPWLVSQPLFPANRVTWVLDIESTSAMPDKITSVEIAQHEKDIPTPEIKKDVGDKAIPSSPSQNEPTVNVTTGSHTSVSATTKDESNWASPALVAWWQQAQTSHSDAVAEQWLIDTATKLKTALMGYNLQAKVLGQRLTPNAAIVRLKGTDNLGIIDIEKKRSPILTTHGLQIINLTAQPGEIQVAIARPQRQTIYLGEVLARRKLNRSIARVNLSFVIAVKELDGELLYLNLGSNFENLQQHAPHTLIAGATGSGKSVLLRNLLLDIAATNSPDLVNIYLIDTKSGADYFPFEDLPHFPEGIIIEQERAIAIFDQIVEEMDRRYKQFRDQKVNSLSAYNLKVEKKLPFIFLVHDEFADWMLVEEYKNAISAAVQRLGVKARAAGIHLIFAAQRPDNSVFPMQLRSNLDNRLILKVADEGTSEIALGRKGAEYLLGRGHLVARLSSEPELIYAQVPFLSDEEFPILVDIVRSLANLT
ncbi:FtsK/SpoIIIE domain-containing protein [Phormidium tenue]|uniref:DNA translocase FtsK n=1 Tax=Phormidium tenue FACHB-1050 TaxID=2692857 RepID=A0ABR8C870_9CYAN|nr:FtsK/SpoIIIE domain-containing protein [Phormidium tenue]MBD2316355.1 DNA translocase FtsK [Phormidium tenue FACHB-1050]